MPGERTAGQVAIGGRDNAGIDGAGLEFPDAQHRALLQNPEERGLNADRQLADFIQEQSSTAGRLKQPHLVIGGAGKRPATVAKELAGGEFFAQSSAVDGDKRPGSAGR